MNKLIFQLVLQLTELTCGGQQAGGTAGRASCLQWTVLKTKEGKGERGSHPSSCRRWLRVLPAAKVRPDPCGSQRVGQR